MRLQGHAIFSLLLLLLGAMAVYFGYGYGIITANGGIAPGFMPVLSGAILGVFSLLTLVSQRRQADTEESAPPQVDETAGAPRSKGYLLAVSVLMILAVYAAPLIGFLIAFGLLVFALVTLVERESILVGIVTSVVGVLLSWLVFVWLLGIPLPNPLLDGSFL